jgi:hypothetical protein
VRSLISSHTGFPASPRPEFRSASHQTRTDRLSAESKFGTDSRRRKTGSVEFDGSMHLVGGDSPNSTGDAGPLEDGCHGRLVDPKLCRQFPDRLAVLIGGAQVCGLAG